MLVAAVVVTFLVSLRPVQPLHMPRFFGDGMVLQSNNQCTCLGCCEVHIAPLISTNGMDLVRSIRVLAPHGSCCRSPLADGVRSFLSGWADPHEKVTVTAPSGPGKSRQETYTTLADADGTWAIQLNPPGNPLNKGGGSATITVTGSKHGGEPLVAKNVSFGDVILCAGGATMSTPLGATAIATTPFPPGIRVFTVGQAVAKASPSGRPDVPANSTGWISVHDGPATMVAAASALCIQSAAELLRLYPRASGRKLGIIVAATQHDEDLAMWMPDATANSAASVCRPPNASSPARLVAMPTRYNAMIAPFTLTSFRAVLWALSPMLRGSVKLEACRFRAMINGWRDAMPVGDIAFHIVQSQIHNHGQI